MVCWYSHSAYIFFNTLCILLHLALGDLIKQVLKCCTNLDTYLAGGCYMLCMLISPPLGKITRAGPNVNTACIGTCRFRTFCHYTVARLLKQVSPELSLCFFIISEGFIIIRRVCRYKVRKELPPHTHTHTHSSSLNNKGAAENIILKV